MSFDIVPVAPQGLAYPQVLHLIPSPYMTSFPYILRATLVMNEPIPTPSGIDPLVDDP